MRLNDNDRTLIAFVAVLIVIGFLSKVGDGINMAVLTPLLTVLGALGQNFRKSQIERKEQP